VFEDETCPAIVDPNQLATAILNLALNARDAMPDGGRLLFRTANFTRNEHDAEVGGLGAGDYVAIEVHDSGAGILRQITQYLYERKIIGLPDPIVGKGPRGQCSWDLPPQEWTFGTDRGWNGIDIRLACPRGIQISKQYNDDFPDAETRYLG